MHACSPLELSPSQRRSMWETPDLSEQLLLLNLVNYSKLYSLKYGVLFYIFIFGAVVSQALLRRPAGPLGILGQAGRYFSARS